MFSRVKTLFQLIPGAEYPGDTPRKKQSSECSGDTRLKKQTVCGVQKKRFSGLPESQSDVNNKNFEATVPMETSSLLNDGVLQSSPLKSYFSNKLCNVPLESRNVSSSNSKGHQKNLADENVAESNPNPEIEVQSPTVGKQADLLPRPTSTSFCFFQPPCDRIQETTDTFENAVVNKEPITEKDIINAEIILYDCETNTDSIIQNYSTNFEINEEDVTGSDIINAGLGLHYSETQKGFTPQASVNTESNVENTTDDKIINDDLNTLDSEVDTTPAQKQSASESKKESKRRYINKKWYCPYCETLVTHFSRHVQSKHGCEEEIKNLVRFSGLDGKEKKRHITAALNVVRNRGAMLFNEKKSRDEEIIVKKNPSNYSYKPTVLTHATCKHCFTSLLRQNLYLHVKNCPNRTQRMTNEDNKISPRGRVLKTASHLQYKHTDKNQSDSFWTEVLMKMKNDMVTLIAKSDPLIFKFGQRLFKNHREQQHRKYVSNKMRDLSRLFLQMEQDSNDINSFEDCIQPYNFNLLVKGVQTLGGFDDESGTVEVISIAHRFCSSLKSCADILLSESIKSKDLTEDERKSIRSRMERFHHLMRVEWKFEIGSNAEKCRKRNHAKKIDICPLDDDIALVSTELENMYGPLITALQENPTDYNYQALCKVIIADIIILCRRRPGEVVRATLEQYSKLRNDEESLSQFNSVLSADEKQAYEELLVFHVPGKNNKKVPILLTKNMNRGIEALLQHWETLQIPCNGTSLLFARPDTTEPFDGSIIISKISKKYDLKNRDHFTATGLRHHIATTSQLHEKDGSFTENLASFMGHTLQIHNSNHRLPLTVIEKAKVVSKLLQIAKKSITSQKLHRAEHENPEKATLSKFDRDNNAPRIDCREDEEMNDQSPDDINYCDKNPEENRSLQTLEANKDPDYTPDYCYSSENEAFRSEPVKNKQQRKRTKIVPWEENEKKIILNEFGDLMLNGVNPKQEDVKHLYAKESILRKRPITSVYTFINNFVNKKLKYENI